MERRHLTFAGAGFRALGLAASAWIAAGTTRAPAVSAPRLVSLEARLLGARTGGLSKNILPPASFSGRNTVIGEGDVTEPADDVLIAVGLAIEGDEGNSDVPLQVKVTGNGKPLAQRTFKSLFFSKGRAVRFLLVEDATCAGSLLVEARFGAQKKSTKVKLDCGE